MKVRAGAAWLTALVGLALLALPGALAAKKSEPPLIEPWHKIGNVALGMFRSSVEYRYGSGDAINPTELTFSIPGGTLDLGFAGKRVTYISTTSAYYRSPEGIGVGTAIPLGPCHRTAKNPCEHRWQGFVFGYGSWRLSTCTAGIPSYAAADVKQGGVITRIAIGFGSTARCSNVNLPPLSPAAKQAIRQKVKDGLSSKTLIVDRVARFVTPQSTREYVGVWANGTFNTGGDVGWVFVIVRLRGGQWNIVSLGTSGVGCGIVPIKYLAEMDVSCPG